MKTSPFFALLLALPFAAAAQTKTTTTTTSPTKASTTAGSTTTGTTTSGTTSGSSSVPAATVPAPPPGTQQQTEVTEELDPNTGKVIRRTTRTINVPVGTGTSTPAPRPSSTSTSADVATSAATDTQVSAFLRRKTTVSTLSTTGLLDAYSRFMDRVHNDRHNWKATDWATASAVLSSLNARYDQLRSSFTFDDKVNIRSMQAEFQTLRTARQLSDQVSDKL